MSAAAWWNDLSEAERGVIVVAIGWYRAKDKEPDRTGRRIIGQTWRELSPAAQKLIAGEHAKVAP